MVDKTGGEKMSDNKFTQSIDVLDMLISVLASHEKKLDELISRIEAVTPRETPSGRQPNDADQFRRFYEPL